MTTKPCDRLECTRIEVFANIELAVEFLPLLIHKKEKKNFQIYTRRKNVNKTQTKMTNCQEDSV